MSNRYLMFHGMKFKGLTKHKSVAESLMKEIDNNQGHITIIREDNSYVNVYTIEEFNKETV